MYCCVHRNLYFLRGKKRSIRTGFDHWEQYHYSAFRADFLKNKVKGGIYRRAERLLLPSLESSSCNRGEEPYRSVALEWTIHTLWRSLSSDLLRAWERPRSSVVYPLWSCSDVCCCSFELPFFFYRLLIETFNHICNFLLGPWSLDLYTGIEPKGNIQTDLELKIKNYLFGDMTDQLGRDEKMNKNHHSITSVESKWRRYGCALALLLSALSVVLCGVNWSQQAAMARRLSSVEQQLAELTSGSSQVHSRTIRQVASSSAPAECQCPPGKNWSFPFFSNPSYILSHTFFFWYNLWL